MAFNSYKYLGGSKWSRKMMIRSEGLFNTTQEYAYLEDKK
jgi:hypothetical protein